MYAGILGEGINHDQPIGSHEIDCMVQMKATPWLLWEHPWVNWKLHWLVLIFSTGTTLLAELLDVSIDSGPVDSCSGKLLHPLHSKVSQMQELQYLWLETKWNHNPGSIEQASI